MRTTHILLVGIFLSFSLTIFGQKNIVILHTNDTHSRIEPIPENDRVAPDLGGVVRRKAFIDRVRNENRNVLLFDSGDFTQGTPYFNLFKGKVDIEAKNLMGYTAITLGNHEFDYGMEVLEDIVRRAQFPVVCSNYDFSETALAGTIKPYLVIEKEGIRIGIIGANIQLLGLVASDHYEGVKFLDPVEMANKYAALLRSKYKADMVICLSHLGFRADVALAEASRNIDLILGGHSHTHMEEPEFRKNIDGQEVMIFQTAGRGANVARVDVAFERK
jgi:5'-nucleotidase